ncbi:serine/threonine protein kinase [Sporosarcina sp. P13]|uniref:serine/threonine protein kinase n=1 Tax=Sporosarcina sp. P13 TaxID=2048263 RepID=UPI000C16C62C|nr:serine/threonine protein kinase [Sporosarcina sp. P13]PIC64633.1 serine/threonine protein kinase [Sporosarcina sp. P13]
MSTYLELVNSVIINKKNRLISCDPSLQIVGIGRSAFVFRVKSSNKAIKVFFPDFAYIAREEAEIYTSLEDIQYFPSIYETGLNYVVMDYIEGDTLFECITQGKMITVDHIKEIDHALLLASKRGLNPSDIHLRNIIITPDDEIKLIDVARYRQIKDCRQWSDLKNAYCQFYRKYFFMKKVPSSLLNTVAFLYKKGLILSYRSYRL